MVHSLPDFPVAHSPGPDGDWDPLIDHSRRVATLARRFASAFGDAELGYLAGLFHDAFKSNPEFAQYLLASHVAAVSGLPRPSQSAPHARGGAALAYTVFKKLGRPEWEIVAPCIAGHHSGLPCVSTLESDLQQFIHDHPTAIPLMAGLVKQFDLDLTRLRPSPPGEDRFQSEMRTRMLFSALVDADFLATERHFAPARAARRNAPPGLEALWASFQDRPPPATDASEPVRSVRREVYEDSVRAAIQSPGFFQLTVPTGGGKTRSGLAFALRHAIEHGLRTLVFALPYTSIIDQTARAYRSALPTAAVLEHHSAMDLPDDERSEEDPEAVRLASENWDRPVVVTTTVQLFQSLFASRPRKVRKVHRLARSVIVLDEIQSFPPRLLEPTIDALAWLVRPIEQGGGGSSVVFCTATQPPFDEGPLARYFVGLPVRQIVPHAERHFAVLRRVVYEYRKHPVSWAELAAELRGRDQVLTVVNTRRDALALLDALGDDPHHFHLSTLLCPAHRRDVLSAVQRRLQSDGLPVRLISTQVVECGVELDFPDVFRALGPLDRIVQAAGRSNRHGLRPQGRVVIFEPIAARSPGGPYRRGLEKARLLLDHYPPEVLHEPWLHQEYFRRLYAELPLDELDIQLARGERDFPKVAACYRLIDDDTVPVVVPYGTAWEPRLAAWQADPTQETWNRLRPFVVGVYRAEINRYGDAITEIADGVFRCNADGYDGKTHRGLLGGFADPSDLFPSTSAATEAPE